MDDLIKYCEDCKFAVWDRDSAYGDKYFPSMMQPPLELVDCRKDFYPTYNDEEECIECEGKEYINDRSD